MSTAPPAKSSAATSQECNYCAGTGRWTKDVVFGRAPEAVYCPHCHGSGVGGADTGGSD